jgi:hypothetical protein
LDKPEKPKVEKVQTKMHCFEYDEKEEARNCLESKYLTNSNRMGNKGIRAIEQDEKNL